jgi:hypothetical protein
MKRWIVPALIVTALAVPVIDDLYELVRDRERVAAPREIDLFDDGVLRFEGRDLEIDLRAGRTVDDDEPVMPDFSLGEEWSPPGDAGVWTLGYRASIDIRLMNGGQRGLMLQCRPDRRREPPPILAVTVNGVDCGSVQLTRDLSVVRLALPEGAIGSGDNRLELELRSALQPTRPASKRTLLVRRLVLAEGTDADFDEIIARRSPILKATDDTVRVQVPGTLSLEFTAPRPGDVVEFSCGFRRSVSGASCEVVVGRWFPDRNALDVVGTARVSSDRARRRAYRITLGNHSGSSLLRIVIDAHGARAGLELQSPRLVAADP